MLSNLGIGGAIARVVGHIQRVAPMPRPFADLHLRCAQLLEYLHRRRDHGGIGIDHRGRVKLHQVGFQQDPLAAHVQAALPNAFEHAADQVVGIGPRPDNRHRRLSRRPIRQLGRLLHLLQLHTAVSADYGRTREQSELAPGHASARPPARNNL